MELSLERDDLMQTGPTGPGTMRVRDPPPPPPTRPRKRPRFRVSPPRGPPRLLGHASPPAQRQIADCRGGLLKPRCGELFGAWKERGAGLVLSRFCAGDQGLPRRASSRGSELTKSPGCPCLLSSCRWARNASRRWHSGMQTVWYSAWQ